MRVFIGDHRGGGFAGWSIRLFDWSRVGHSSLRFGTGGPDDLVFQAGFSEGYHRVFRHQIEGPVQWREITHLLPAGRRIRLLSLAEKLVGTEYDRWSIIRFLPILRMFYAGEAFGSKEKVFCSEAVSYLCRQVGLVLLNKPDNRITPGDLATSPLPVATDIV